VKGNFEYFSEKEYKETPVSKWANDTIKKN
jgi:hypothetical protein